MTCATSFKALVSTKYAGANMVVPLSWCPHLDTCLASDSPETIEPKAPCMECANVGENWICLKVRWSWKIYSSEYRVTHQVVPNLMLTSKRRLCFSICSSY